MADDDFQAISDYGKAVQQLADSADSAASAFASAAKGSEAWTMASRILSGSGLWKLQNYVRSVGNAINIFNNNSQESEMKMIKQMEATMQLSTTYSDLAKSIAQAEEQTGDYFEMVSKLKPELSAAEASALSVAKLTDIQTRVGSKMLEIGKKADAMPRFETVKKYSSTLMKKGGEGTDRSKFGYLGEMSKNMAEKFSKTKDITGKGKKVQDMLSNVLKSAGKGISFFFKSIPLLMKNVLSLLMGVMIQGILYITLIALGIMVLVNIFKKMKLGSVLKNVMGNLGIMTNLLDGVKGVLSGLWQMLTSVFKGDFSGFFSGMYKVFIGVGNIIIAFLKIYIGIVIAGFIGAINLLPAKTATAIKNALKSLIGFKAMGGPASGLTVVGERGPELLSLPRGSRVHSNAQSQTMGGGNNIHVHVSGRVGASDTEIRDIANKVAREINLRMNRTGNAVGRF